MPSRRRWCETPPLSARPATPVSDTTPPGAASPSGAVTWSTSAHVAPPWTWTVRPPSSRRTPRIGDRSMTRPSSTMAVPATLWPPPRTERGSACTAANRTAVATSLASAQRAMSAGRLSIIPFQTRRASSYAGWSGVMTAPVRRSASAAARWVVMGWMAMGQASGRAVRRSSRSASEIRPARVPPGPHPRSALAGRLRPDVPRRAPARRCATRCTSCAGRSRSRPTTRSCRRPAGRTEAGRGPRRSVGVAPVPGRRRPRGRGGRRWRRAARRVRR